jgi:hypothetical protein
MLVICIAVLSILQPNGIFYGHWYIFPRFGILYRLKSGNPAPGINLTKLHFGQAAFGQFFCRLGYV